MPLQMTNPVVVGKIEGLAKATGLPKTAVVERAIDRVAAEIHGAPIPRPIAALLAQLDRIPDREDALDPL